ncbi:MAG: STAS domain-containing protein [Chloroflexi bacterium]|nr:STAS domain-containing protein [Chloroflexota bacterium]MCL5274733.1 STAS domain-containing protein [Chloroflexota bacterium]
MIAILNVRESAYAPAGGEGESAHKPIPILTVTGRLDASTVNILERAITRALSQGAKVVVIDAGEITYISSSGLRVLLTARRQIRERGGDILLCSLSPNVRDVMNMVGFTALFSIYENVDAAKQVAAHIK